MGELFQLNPSAPRTLRPHQARAIEMLRQSLAQGKHRVVLQAATGFGKTLTAAKIIESALSRGRKVLFTVPRLSLVDQTVAEFLCEGIEHIGVIQANHPRTDPDAPVQVASVQTLARRPAPDGFGLVLVDECHETFKVIYDLMERWPSVHFVGLSATPWTAGMGKHWEGLCVSATISQLIDAGFLSKFMVYAPDVPDLSGVRIVKGDYAEDSLSEIMGENKIIASVVQTWLSKGQNRPTLCFGVNRAHAKDLFRQFTSAGVAAAYCDAYTDSVERGIIARQFRAGEVKVACSVRTLTTGVDWPVSCIIDAAPTKSEMLHVQKIGRGLRINPGTEDLIVLDHAGNSLRLGLVTDVHHEELDKGKKKDVSGGGKKAVPLPKECSNCKVLFVGKVCPSCGQERQAPPGIEEADGELVVITGKPKTVTMDEKQRWYSGLLWVAADRGYKAGWAYHKFRSKFGVAPHHSLVTIPSFPSRDVFNWIKSEQIRWAKVQEKDRRAAG